MAWVFFVFGAVLVTAIALYAVGRATGEMAGQRPPAVYELPAAVDWIADRLPDEVTARISYDDVTRILTWHLDWFTSVGVSSEHGEELGGRTSSTRVQSLSKTLPSTQSWRSPWRPESRSMPSMSSVFSTCRWRTSARSAP